LEELMIAHRDIVVNLKALNIFHVDNEDFQVFLVEFTKVRRVDFTLFLIHAELGVKALLAPTNRPQDLVHVVELLNASVLERDWY
jgi:hypothetical protein